MPWFRVDDAFARHRKVLKIPRARRKAAIGLWTLAGTWAAQNLTDGQLPAYMLDEFDADEQEVSDLLAAGLWERDGDDYVIHDYLDYNPSREQVLAEREAAKQRQRRARERASSKRRDDGSSSGEVRAKSRRDSGVTHDEVTAASRSPRPDPTRPGGERAREDVASSVGPEPPLRCPEHEHVPHPPPCGGCADARREHEVWARRRTERPSAWTPCPVHADQPAGRCRRCEADAVPSPLRRAGRAVS